MTSEELFSRLVYLADSDLWNEFELQRLSQVQLRTLAMLWGAPKSGTKELVIIRILAVRQVRLKLGPFKEDTEASITPIVSAFRKEQLKHMARECGLWRSGNKAQLAAVLLSWRARARARGEDLLRQMLSAGRSQPRQMLLAL